MRKAALLAALLAMARPAGSGEPERGSLTVEIQGFRNGKGLAQVSLFVSKEGFPADPGKALRTASAPIVGLEAQVAFPDLPPGAYAVSVLHDENANRKLDSNWLGMPKEGIGVSNGPKIALRAPSFESARFELGVSSKTLQIRLQYLR